MVDLEALQWKHRHDGWLADPQMEALFAEVRALRAEREALQRFKDFVHRRLDTAGVPTHPDGPHSKEGCRIGDRLDLVIEKHEAELAEARASYDAAHSANTKLHDALVAAKAELAKAWEAGRDAAADCIEAVPDYSDMPTRNRIRALQPPGGKHV